MKLTLLLILCLLVFGCTANGPKFSGLQIPEENEAVIYVFRNSGLFDYGGAYPKFGVNGEGNYPLKNHGYLRFVVDPGAYNFAVIEKLDLMTMLKWPKRDVSLEVLTGGIYYIQYHVYSSGIARSGNYSTRELQTYFKLLGSEDALPILDKTKLIKSIDLTSASIVTLAQ